MHGIKGELESVKGDVRGLKGDMVTVQKDVFALKGDVACLQHDVCSLQSSANPIEEALTGIKSLIRPFPVVNAGPQRVTLPQHFVPNTEDDLSQWPSSEEAGQVEYAEAGPSTSQPGYITVVGRTSADSEFQTVGYIKKLPEGTDLPEVENSPPETEGNKTPLSAKKRKTRASFALEHRNFTKGRTARLMVDVAHPPWVSLMRLKIQPVARYLST